MRSKKASICILWVGTLVYAICAFLPWLQSSFNRYPVNIFGICEEFASRNHATLDIFPPLGYATFAMLMVAVICQVIYTISAMRSSSKVNGLCKLSLGTTIISVIAFVGYLLFVDSRSEYSLTIALFLMAIAPVIYIVFSIRVIKLS